MYEHITPETIEANILKSLGFWASSEGSFARTLISPSAYEIWKTYTALEGISDIIFPDANSGAYIDKKAADFGIIRKEGAKASAAVSFIGRTGTVIPAGKAFLTKNGLVFTLDSAVTLTEGTGSGTLSAVSQGSAYNVAAGDISVQQSPLSGLEQFSTGEASGGIDPESDEDLVRRYYAYLQKPATSGNVYQYIQWAETIPGVSKAKVFPLWQGAGTVRVVLAGAENGAVSEEIVSNCAAYIETVRPIGAKVTVSSASTLPISAAAKVVLSPTVTASQAESEFKKALSEYLREISFEKTTVVYNRVLSLLIEVDGVQDVVSLTVNGKTGNLTLLEDQVPELWEVSVGV